MAAFSGRSRWRHHRRSYGCARCGFARVLVCLWPGLLGNLKVGLIEEFVKGVAIVLFALGLRSYSTRDGMVLGATIGFGFAALESSGYASPSSSRTVGFHLSNVFGKLGLASRDELRGMRLGKDLV